MMRNDHPVPDPEPVEPVPDLCDCPDELVPQDRAGFRFRAGKLEKIRSTKAATDEIQNELSRTGTRPRYAPQAGPARARVGHHRHESVVGHARIMPRRRLESS
jgi:hypothetical protein